jgi:hypothetical protein
MLRYEIALLRTLYSTIKDVYTAPVNAGQRPYFI